MKKNISILSLIFLITNFISPISSSATVTANVETSINIENTESTNSDEEILVEDTDEITDVNNNESEEVPQEESNLEESNLEESIIEESTIEESTIEEYKNEVQATDVSWWDNKYDKEYIENVKNAKLYNSIAENLDSIDGNLSKENIVKGYEVLKNKTDDNYEVAITDSNGDYYFIGSSDDYNEAMNILKNIEMPISEEIFLPVIINSDGRVVYTTNGIGYIVNTGNANINIHSTSSLNSAYTYVNQGYVNDIPVIEITSTAAKIQVNGYIGWVSINDIEILPVNQIKNLSYYIVNDGILKHYISKDVTGSVGHIIEVGVSPDYLKNNVKYLSYDGIYFYEMSSSENAINSLVSDLKNNNKNNSVNRNNPYYSYYQYLPFRSKTSYTATELNSYISAKTSETSKLRGIGQALKDAEDKYGINALLILGVAINESGWGTSTIAQTKNNLFGIKAFDSDVNQASTFNTPGDSVLEFAKNYISIGYSNPKNWRYYGGFLGNKNLGANVKYASDPFWGEKAAKYALSVDLYFAGNNVKKLRDYNRYKIGVYTSTNDVKDYAGKTLYNISTSQRNLGATFIITSNNTFNISGETRYEIYPEITSTNFDGIYNWNNKGYVKTNGVQIVSDGSNNSSIISPVPDEPTGVKGVIYTTNVESYGWQDWKSNGETAGTEGQGKRIESIKVKLADYQNATIRYSVHVQDIGWQDWKSNGETAGTEGQSKRIEAIKIESSGLPENVEVQYRVHVQNKGWQDWKSNGEIAGSVGQELRVEAIEIRVIDPKSITYTTHVQDYGWQQWVSNGELSGTEGKSKRLEAIKIKFDSYPAANVRYSTHIQDIGWQSWKSNGELSGTEGRSKRLEAIKIQADGLPEGMEIQYRVHLEEKGWQPWVSNGEVAGTIGKGLRLEAIEIKIVEVPTVKYKGHIEDIGWQSWKRDGELAGTSGQAKRLEAITIEADNLPEGAYIRYMTHVQDLGWEKEWSTEGEISGSVGKLKRLEAIKIELVGAPGYHIEYMTHIQNVGWEKVWKRDGEISGTVGQSKRLEGIKIKVVQD